MIYQILFSIKCRDFSLQNRDVHEHVRCHMGYEYLREQYPEIISKDQLYRICNISKRKAQWLLENGIIPCEDSGKQTRRFHIRLEDVITFLERRDAGLLQAEIPVGIFSRRDLHEYRG